MEGLKEKFDKNEKESKEKYDDFYGKNHKNQFLNELSLLRFKAYTYTKLVGLVVNNFD
jgi:hypothetical protein